MSGESNQQVAWNGRHLRVIVRDGWEYVTRNKVAGIVGIVAVTEENKLILVEQHRTPVGARVIELPAGLVGDQPGHEDESLAIAARRELLEETGYEAEHIEPLIEGTSSAGLTDERVTLVRAGGLRRVAAGGGDASERITVHEIPVPDVYRWLIEQTAGQAAVDFRVFAALFLIASPPAPDSPERVPRT